MQIEAQTQARLALAASYRAFLQIYFEELKISYAEVGRRGGFSSRSYPRDVTEGRRRLTAKSLPSLSRGLRLKGELSKVFQLLYFAENIEEHPDAISHVELLGRLETSRKRAAKQSVTRKKSKIIELGQNEVGETYAIADGLTDVIASLGSSGDGMTLDAISKKTGFSKTVLATKLELLKSKSVVRYNANSRRYFSSADHVDWTGEAGSRLAKAIYQSSVERLTLATRTSFENPEALFLNTAISVSKANLPKLRAELKDLLMKFSDKTIEGENGDDTVIQIVTGLFEGRLAGALLD